MSEATNSESKKIDLATISPELRKVIEFDEVPEQMFEMVKRWAKAAAASSRSLLHICCRILAPLSPAEVLKEQLKPICTGYKLICYKVI